MVDIPQERVQVRDAEAPARAIGLDARSTVLEISCVVRGVDDAEERSPDDGVGGESEHLTRASSQHSDGLGVVYSHDGVRRTRGSWPR